MNGQRGKRKIRRTIYDVPRTDKLTRSNVAEMLHKSFTNYIYDGQNLIIPQIVS